MRQILQANYNTNSVFFTSVSTMWKNNPFRRAIYRAGYRLDITELYDGYLQTALNPLKSESSMKKGKTTILLVSKDQKAVKPRQVSGSIILNWKKYLAVFSLVILVLCAAIGYLILDRQEHVAVQITLNGKIEELHKSFQEIDTLAIRKRFTNIDKELETINKYLKARGINQTVQLPQGGAETDILLSAEETGEFYERYLKKISYHFAHIPLGYPFKGVVTSTFGYRENPFGGRRIETHSGLDIRAPMGAAVKSMAKGTVTFAGSKGGYGNCIIIRHIGGYETLYGHLSKISVKRGQQVEVGEQIGKVGSTGRSTGPHLHYEVLKNGKRINPKAFLTLN